MSLFRGCSDACVTHSRHVNARCRLSCCVSEDRSSQTRTLVRVTRQKAVLNSSDRLYEELRDQSFAAVGPRLGEKAKAIQVNYQVRWARRTCQRHLR